MEEKIVLVTKPTWKVIIIPLIEMCIMIGLITIWKPLIAIFTTKLKITNKRIEGKIGFLRTEKMDSRIEQITSVKVTQSLTGKILKYGTVNINTAGGNYEFRYIPNPERVRKVINNAIDSTIKI